MNFDFSAFLLLSTVVTGVIVLLNHFIWRPRRLMLLSGGSSIDGQYPDDHEPILIEYARAFFPVLLLVLILRSFIIEPFRIPSGSMKPTLLVGDFILVNKYTYGLRLPVFNTQITEGNKPQRGDVMVFKYPVDPTEYFIKRVIGLPGDKIEYRHKQLYINGELIDKTNLETKKIRSEDAEEYSVRHWVEHLGRVEHQIYERLSPGHEAGGIVVPQGHYFMMGDNRDDSDDSRIWGFVPEKNIVGKAFAVWLSWDADKTWFRFDQVPREIH